MNSKAIKDKLNELGYEQSTVSMYKENQFKVVISGSVHVNEIKDSLNVLDWEYKGNKVVLTLAG